MCTLICSFSDFVRTISRDVLSIARAVCMIAPISAITYLLCVPTSALADPGDIDRMSEDLFGNPGNGESLVSPSGVRHVRCQRL
jgi:hypothetical protein